MSENEQILLEGALLFWERDYYSQNIDFDRLFIEHTEHSSKCIFKNTH